jgi:hypothetical protein
MDIGSSRRDVLMGLAAVGAMVRQTRESSAARTGAA